MRFVKPEVFLIYRSQPEKEEIRRWLDFVGASEYSENLDWNAVTAGEQLVQLAGKRCYMSYQVGLNPNITRIRTDMTDFITNILKVGHGSVLAHAWYTFAIENVSRVFTGEMNRHGIGSAISEGSMRFIRYTDIPIVDVSSIQPHESDTPDIIQRKAQTRAVIASAADNASTSYESIRYIWSDVLDGPDFAGKKHITSMMRRVIPMGVATGGVWSYNLRSLRNIFELRCSKAAEEEILAVACMMLETMMKTEPNIFSDFKKNVEGFYVPQYHKV